MTDNIQRLSKVQQLKVSAWTGLNMSPSYLYQGADATFVLQLLVGAFAVLLSKSCQ